LKENGGTKVSEKEMREQKARAVEEEYFRTKEQELIEKLRRRAELQTRRGELSELKGVIDDDVLQTLHEIGYNRHTVALLHLVPLIQVAWASGRVTRNERELIIEAARLRGIRQGSAAYIQLEDWLNKPPEEYFFEKTLRIIGDLVQAAPQPDQARSRHGLFTQCVRVAAASGGILGLGSRISDEELSLLEHIAKVIGGQSEDDQ
jgi:hypothetical protein